MRNSSIRRSRSKNNVARHYDLDGRLYSLFLDADKQYSCAYFETPDMTLDDAQLAKKRHLAAKLLIGNGDRVLDIGSGWGGLGLYLAEMTGADVTGVTLSTEQLQVSNARADEKDLSRSARFLLEDYREIPGPFDRIVSVGMFEHVGVDFYDTYFKRCAELLTDDGVMVLHSIGRSDGPDVTNPWITKYIFPGRLHPGAFGSRSRRSNARGFWCATSRSCGCITRKRSKPGASVSWRGGRKPCGSMTSALRGCGNSTSPGRRCRFASRT